MHEIRLTLSATDDLMNAFTFYESREAGVGNYFLQCLTSDIDSLGLYAGILPKSYLGFYRTAFKRTAVCKSLNALNERGSTH